jgi:AcrR family transcriptional regulator
MSLRKEKAALIKLAVLDHTIKLIGVKAFDKLHVDEICKKAKISKVTLFKYFPQKEDILLYYFKVWALRRLVELKERPKEGLAGIHYLFDKIGEDFETHPGIVLSWVGYLSDLSRSLKPFPLKPEEKKLLFPEDPDIQLVELQSLDQLVEKFSLEAIFKKEITKTGSTRDIVNAILSILYGSIITAHNNQISPFKMFLRKNLESLLRGF